MKVLAFSGSNSASSINQQLIEYTVKHLNVTTDILDLREYDIPMFGIDEENKNGFPKALESLFDTFQSYDAYVISIPEHNGNYPAFFKNIIDWLTRMEREFLKGKPVLLLSAVPGKNGGRSVLDIAEKSFPFFGGDVIGTFVLPEFQTFKTNKGIEIDNTEIITAFHKGIERFEAFLEEVEKA